jgi:hypothetical protein
MYAPPAVLSIAVKYCALVHRRNINGRRDMLSEYFSLTIAVDGRVESLPLLLRDYVPNLDKLPSLLMRLGLQVKLQVHPCGHFAYHLCKC